MITMLSLFLGASAYAETIVTTDSGSSVAYDRVGRVDWGILGGGAFNDTIDEAGYVQTSVSYGVTPWIAIGVEGGWQQADGAASHEETGIVQVMGDIIVRVPEHPFHEALVPYGVLGLGVIGVYTEAEPTATTQNGDDADDTVFGWKLGAGFDWFLNQNWAINFEVAYFDSSELDLAPTSMGNNAEIDFWTVGGGLKWVW